MGYYQCNTNTISVALVCVLGLAMVHYSLAQNSPQDYIDAHNAARAAVNVGPMTWDESVANFAQRYTEQRKGDCRLVHSTNQTYGENLASGSGFEFTGKDAVELWVGEKQYYYYNTNACAVGQVCGHYTQVVWQNSVRLGCARVQCNSGAWFITCNYDPPGNYVGQRPYGQGPAQGPTQGPAQGPTQGPAQGPEQGPAEAGPAEGPAQGQAQGEEKKIVLGEKKENKKRLVVGLSISLCILVGGLILVGFNFSLWKKRRRRRREEERFDEYMDNEFKMGSGPKKFSYYELARATNNFAEEEKLGEGGFGGVYRGCLRELSSYIAVKRVSRNSKQGIKEYASEVKIISRLRHRNLVQLLGWCHDKGELLLIYEFMENGSLDFHLFKGKSLLSWEVRFKIAQGLASALLYLHEEWEQCVVHRDVKSSNIMLDSSFNAKLGDFGLARLVDHEKGSQTTIVAGTRGYMAPEYMNTGKASRESDVYSFGVVALEIACGRKPIDVMVQENQIVMVEWVWGLYGIGKLLEAVDPKLCTDFNEQETECLMTLGLWCAHPDSKLRPSIRQVIHVLNLEVSLPVLPSKMPVATYSAPTFSSSLSYCENSLHQAITAPSIPRS